MRKTLQSAIAPLLSIALLMLGGGFFTTFVSLRLHMAKYDATVIGVVQAAYYAGFLIGALKIENLIKRIRHIRAYAFFACLCTAIVLFQGIYINPVAWVIERFIQGLCIASLYVVIESWLLIIAPDDSRGKLLALYMIALYAAQAVSQFFVDALDMRSLTPYLVVGILGSLSMMPVTFTRTQIPDLPDTDTKGLFHVFKRSPFGCLGCMISGIIISSIYSFLPPYADELHISVALSMSLAIAGGFILQWPLGYLSDVFDRRKILFLISVLTIAPCAGIVFFKMQAGIIYALVFFLGGFTFTLYPLSITHVTDRFQSSDMTSVTAVLLFAYSIGAVVGPLLAPIFIDSLPPNGLFVFIGALGALLSAMGCYSLIRYKPVPKLKQGDFMPMSGQSPLGPELDPRSQDDETKAD